MNMPTQSQINAGLRYAGTWVTAGGGALVMLGAIPPDKAHALVDALQGTLTDLQSLIGHFYIIASIVGPGLAFWLGKIGWNSASPKSQIASVQALPQAQVTVTDPKLAEGIPGVTVAQQGA